MRQADDFTGMLRTFEPDRGAFESPFAIAVSSIDEVPAILVYPNPFNDFLIVKTDDSSQKVSLLDILGREIMNHIERINGVGSIQLNTAELDQGIYILKTENTSSKVIKYFRMIQKAKLGDRLIIIFFLATNFLLGQINLIENPDFFNNVDQWNTTGDATLNHINNGAFTLATNDENVFCPS